MRYVGCIASHLQLHLVLFMFAEQINHLPTHSTRAPNEDWLKYRDHPSDGVLAQIKIYEKFVTYWMEKYADRSNLLLVEYEKLTSNESHKCAVEIESNKIDRQCMKGPMEAIRIANFLGEQEGVDPIAEESIPCVWEHVVNYKSEEEMNAGKRKDGRKLRKVDGDWVSSVRTGPKVRPYSKELLDEMLALLQRLAEKYSNDEEFVTIMSSYIETVSKTPVEYGHFDQ